MRASATVLLLAIALGGCAAAPSPPAADAAREAEPTGVLRGQVVLPAGHTAVTAGRLQLQLLPRFAPSPAPIAEARLELEGPPPWPFRLAFPRRAVQDPTLYRLEVALFDTEGHLRFVSDGEHPVNLGAEAEPARVELIALDPGQPEIGELDCEGKIVTLRFGEPDLELSLDARSHRLRRARAALGRRYLGADAELWLDADGALLQLGADRFSCVAVPPAAR